MINKIITMNNSLAEEYPDLFTNDMESMKYNDAVVKEPETKFIGSNSFKFWLEVDKIRKANTRKDLSIIKRFKNSENEQEEIYNFYELRDWVVNSLKKEKLIN